MTPDDCPFCELIDNGPVEQNYANAVVRFEPLNPVVPGHMLFVPTEHIEHSAISSIEVGTAMRYAHYYGRKQGGDFNLITSAGPAATQTIAHVHVHYVPRTPDDGLTLPWTGQTR